MHEFKNTMKGLEQMLAMAKLAENMQNQLDDVRFYHESTMETLKRVIEKAKKILCPDCRGDGYWCDQKCPRCGGCGEIRYDPHERDVDEVMTS